MKIKDIISIIVGGLTTLILWRILYPFVEEYLLLAIPCSMVGGYIAGRLRTNGIPSGPVSGIIAGIVMMIDMIVREGDVRSTMFGIIITIIFIIGGGLGELIFNIVKNRPNE